MAAAWAARRLYLVSASLDTLALWTFSFWRDSFSFLLAAALAPSSFLLADALRPDSLACRRAARFLVCFSLILFTAAWVLMAAAARAALSWLLLARAANLACPLATAALNFLRLEAFCLASLFWRALYWALMAAFLAADFALVWVHFFWMSLQSFLLNAILLLMCVMRALAAARRFMDTFLAALPAFLTALIWLAKNLAAFFFCASIFF